jgi:hypothetical protein
MMRADRAEKLISLAALGFAIELVLFKFLPDVSTAVIQQSRSTLADFGEFEREYLVPGSVHHARFLGNYLLYDLARWLSRFFHSSDIRLHPLRVATGLLTPLYAYVGAAFALMDRRQFDWRYFIVPYGLAVVIGLYVFYPADMPALACLSIALYFLLTRKRALALLFMLVTGLFRETSFHMVALVLLWAWCDTSVGLRERFLWIAAFALAFVAEYVTIRHFFPGPVSSAAGGIILDPRVVLLDRGMLSLTTICSLGLAALFPLQCLVELRRVAAGGDWQRRFFVLNCYAFPAWVLFYRMMNGNLAEFRMLYPAILPCMYGMAHAAQRRTVQCV